MEDFNSSINNYKNNYNYFYNLLNNNNNKYNNNNEVEYNLSYNNSLIKWNNENDNGNLMWYEIDGGRWLNDRNEEMIRYLKSSHFKLQEFEFLSKIQVNNNFYNYYFLNTTTITSTTNIINNLQFLNGKIYDINFPLFFLNNFFYNEPMEIEFFHF